MPFQPDLMELKRLTLRIKYAEKVRNQNPKKPIHYNGDPYPMNPMETEKINTAVMNANLLWTSGENRTSYDFVFESWIHTLLGRGIEKHMLETGEKISDNGYIVDLLLSIKPHLLCDYTKL